MNKKRLFFNFLQKHTALKAYKQAFYMWHDRKLYPSEYYSLGVAFVWASTPEGDAYWRSLDEKWHSYLQSAKKKYHF